MERHVRGPGRMSLRCPAPRDWYRTTRAYRRATGPDLILDGGRLTLPQRHVPHCDKAG